MVWSLPENEISSPQFSADGNFVVLVTRVHWPDGDEAENLPDGFFKGLLDRKARDPRFADPIIRLIDSSGHTVCEARYGTNPVVSPDNKKIAFSRQKKPISGLRPLAETLAGNDIQIFDCEKKETFTLAQPDGGYLDDPIFFADGKSIVYTTNEATNGAMSGPVGIERVEIGSQHKESLLRKETVPAVPCDTVRNKTPLQSFMCRQSSKLSDSFQSLIEKFELADDKVFVLEARPVPSVGDMYLAGTYDLQLISVFPQKTTLVSIGQTKITGLREISFQPLTKDRLIVLSDYWRTFSLESNEWLPQVGPKNKIPASFYSPSGKYYLATEPSDAPDHFTLFRTDDGAKMFVSPVVEGIYGMAWSRDSNRFAVVTLPKGRSGPSYKEELAVYSLR